MKKSTKINVLILLMCVVFSLAACADIPAGDGITKGLAEKVDNDKEIPELSSNILIGFNAGGEGYGTEIDCMSATVMVMKNQSVKVEFMDKIIYEAQIPAESYDNIEKGLNFNKLYYLEVESDPGVLDGSTSCLFFYGPDDEMINTIGAYEPITKAFREARSLLSSNLPMDEITKVVADTKSAYQTYQVYSEYVRMYMIGTTEFALEGADGEPAVYTEDAPGYFKLMDIDSDGIPELLMSPTGESSWSVRGGAYMYSWDRALLGVIDRIDSSTGEMLVISSEENITTASVYKMENKAFTCQYRYTLEGDLESDNCIIHYIGTDETEIETDVDTYKADIERFLPVSDYHENTMANISEYIATAEE